MSFLSSLNISGSALTAQKLRMDVISQNIANADVTRTEQGGPYRRKMVVLSSDGIKNNFSYVLNSSQESLKCSGVEVAGIVEDPEELTPVFDPDHPDADANGYVMMPNVDTVEEMTDMISASRSYEANITAFNAVKQMASKALEIGR